MKYKIKTKKWLNAGDLANKIIDATYEITGIKIRKIFKENGSQPIFGYIEERQSISGVITLCVHENQIKRLCDESGLKLMKKNILKKDENWLSDFDLVGKEIDAERKKIIEGIKKIIKDNGGQQIPGKIEYRKVGNNIQFCLNKTAVPWFCEITKLPRLGISDEWVSLYHASKNWGFKKEYIYELAKCFILCNGKNNNFLRKCENGYNKDIFVKKDKVDFFHKIVVSGKNR